MKKSSLTEGNIGQALLFFVLPIIAGSLIQQLYTTVDAVIVGGIEWTARTDDNETVIEKDTVVEIERIEGVKLIVKKKG